jgi:hypothetical protein
VLAVVAAVALLSLIWISTEDQLTRKAFAFAISASLLLVLETFALGLCGLGENRSALYESRCSGGVPFLPLIGAPVLLLLAAGTRKFGHGRAAWILVFAASAILPWALLSSA